MPAQHLFEYAIVRVVPQVEREEFINVGVILFCPKQKFLKAICQLNEDRLQALGSDKIDLEELKENLAAFSRISSGGINGGPIGKLDIASRFRWLTATRSTVVQTSKVHPGFCIDGQETLDRLFSELVC